MPGPASSKLDDPATEQYDVRDIDELSAEELNLNIDQSLKAILDLAGHRLTNDQINALKFAQLSFRTLVPGN